MEASSSTTTAAAPAAPAVAPAASTTTTQATATPAATPKKRASARLAVSQRAVILTLKLLMNKSYSEIEAITGVRQSTAARVVERALARGCDPARRPFVCKDEWLTDAPRAKRAKKARAAADEGEEGEGEGEEEEA